MTPEFNVTGVALETDALIALRGLALAAGHDPALAALPGGFASRRKGQGLEVADMREYVAGDDLRHLDRGTTARTGRLHVRQFQEDRDRVCLLVADFRKPMFWGVRRAFLSVAAAEVLALYGWQVVEEGGRVAVLALTDAGPVVVPPRGRRRGMLDAIGALVQAHRLGLETVVSGQGREPPTLSSAMVRAGRIVPPGSEIVIASGFDVSGDDLHDQLDALAQRRAVRLLLVTEAGALPRGRYPVQLSDGTLLRLEVGTARDAAPVQAEIAGRDATVIDAGQGPADTIRRLFAGSVTGRAA